MDSGALNDLRAVLARLQRAINRQLAAAEALEYAAREVAVLGFSASMTRCDGNVVLSVAIEPGQMLADLAAWKEMEAALPPAPAPIEDAPAPVVEDPTPIEDVPAPNYTMFGRVVPEHLEYVMRGLPMHMKALNIQLCQVNDVLKSLILDKPAEVIAAEIRRPLWQVRNLIKFLPPYPKARRELLALLEVPE